MKADIKKLVDETKRIVKKKDEEIKLLKSELRTAKGEKTILFKMPDTMEVSNFPALIKVHVENPTPAPEIQKVNVLNLKDLKIPEQKEVQFPDVQKVEVINNEPVEKASAWVPAFVSVVAEKIVGGFGRIIAKGIEVRLAAGERLKPQTVVIVDLDGNPIDMKPRTGGNRGNFSFPMIMRGNVNQDPLDPYQATDIDQASATKYYGFVDKDGNWYILQNNTTAGTFRYIKGSTEYPDNWTNRNTLSYDYFNNIF